MLDENERKYLFLLREKYPNKESVASRLISLARELYLPKGTEHFLSDLHGEYEAFSHIRRSASGVIRRKLDSLFSEQMSSEEIAEIASVIYYPEEKLSEGLQSDEKYERIISSLIELLSAISEKYTRAKVTDTLYSLGEYGKAICELIYSGAGDERREQLASCIKTVIRIKEAKAFINALATAIKKLAVDRVSSAIYSTEVRDLTKSSTSLCPRRRLTYSGETTIFCGSARLAALRYALWELFLIRSATQISTLSRSGTVYLCALLQGLRRTYIWEKVTSAFTQRATRTAL